MVDLGISEAARGTSKFLGNSALGSLARKFANSLERGSTKGAFQINVDRDAINKMLGINKAEASTFSTTPGTPNFSFAEASKLQNSKTKGLAPTSSFKDINAPSSSGSNVNKQVAKIIGAGWEDADDVLKDTKKTLDASGKTISQLGKVRDQYLRANDEHKQKTDEAIAGNKTLIEKNQGQELDDLGGRVRETTKNASLLLGVKGATGGSASRAASKAIAKSAGKERQGILKTRGDEFSEQQQAAENAEEEFKLRRDQAYEWEKTAREQAIGELKTAMASLKKLESKKGGYKDKDIEAQSDKYLTRFLNAVSEISLIGRAIRDNAYAKYQEFGGSVDELESAAINVDAPAELMTPDFDPTIDLTAGEDAEDFFDPNNKGKQRVIIGTDAFGNPIYEDEFAAAEVGV